MKKAEARLVEKLKKALNYINEWGHEGIEGWAELRDELFSEIQLYDPSWSPGDEVTEVG